VTPGARARTAGCLAAALERAPGAPGADLARALLAVHARAVGAEDIAPAAPVAAPPPARPSAARIVAAVSSASGVPVVDILGARRRRDILHARQMAAHLAVRLTGISLPRIGRALDRDHTTVAHSDRRVAARLASGCAATRALETAALAVLGEGAS